MSLSTFDKSTSMRRFERKLERDRSLRTMEEASSSVYNDENYEDDISVASSLTSPSVLSSGSRRDIFSFSSSVVSAPSYPKREPLPKREPRKTSRPIGGYYSKPPNGFHPSVESNSDDDDDCSIISAASCVSTASTSSASVATLSTFDKSERQRRRLIEREKQMRLMEEAATTTASALMSGLIEDPKFRKSSSYTSDRKNRTRHQETPQTPTMTNSTKHASVTPSPPSVSSCADQYKVRDVDLGPSPPPPPPRRGEALRTFLKESEERFNSFLQEQVQGGHSSPSAVSPRQSDAFIPNAYSQGHIGTEQTEGRLDRAKKVVNAVCSRCVVSVGQMVNYVGENLQQYGSCRGNGSCKSKKMLISLIAFVLLVVGIDVTVSSIRHGRSRSSGAAATTTATMGMESCWININGSDTKRYKQILDRILTSGISDQSSLCNIDGGDNDSDVFASPQTRALDWIANQDPRKLDPNHDALLQRYALAVFHFSTHLIQVGDNPSVDNADENEKDTHGKWYVSADWMTEKGICMWFGVQCTPREGHDGNPTDTYDDDVVAVTHLNLSSNGISGVLPPEIFLTLDQMRVLDLSRNFFGGTLPSELGNLLSLEELNLEGNALIGTIPPTIGTMKNLLLLNLAANDLTGSIPSQIEELTNIQYLVLEDNSFEGTISETFGSSLPNLESLFIGSNGLSGTIPSTIGKLTNLKEISVRMNNLVGRIPTEIGLLAHLQNLHIDDNGLGGELPDFFSSLPSLNKIHVERNMLSGKLPDSIGNLENLKVIHMDNNEFDGSIPDSWWEGLPVLEELYLYKNYLSGSISSAIGDKQNLVDVRLSRNRIGGTIPSEIGTLSKLRYLYIEDNGMNGAIPSEMGNLFNLEEMRLYGNEFIGTMPDTVCTLKTPTRVVTAGSMLTANGVEGKVEELGKLEFLAADCRGDTPEVLCSCCDNCRR